MIRKYVLTLLLVSTMFAIPALSQRHARHTHAVKDTTLIQKAYMDSLFQLRARIDSTKLSMLEIDGEYYKLFVPPTFYHSAANKYFGVGKDTLDATRNAIDAALMHLYLYRPTLVQNSEKRLKQAGTIREEIDRPIKQKLELSKHVEPQPEEDHLFVPSGIIVRRPNFWVFNGDGYLQFLQNFVSTNWYKGGESNYSMVGSVTLNANYNNKSKFKWENKLEMKLGFQTSRGDTLHKFKTNNDLLRYTGKVGLQAHRNWYYTLQLLAYTQFTQGLKSNDKKVYSDFMSPFNLNLGLGMDYTISTKNNKLKGSVNLSFLSFNFRYVDRKDLAKRYGVIGDHHTLEDFGSQLTCNLTWQIMNQIQWKTRLYAYTTYKRVEMEWENTIALQVSKYISANIFLYPRFDDSTKRDDKLGYFQFKEYSSLGFSYSF